MFSRAKARQALFLHVGLPKSGTTYLQGLLAEHRDELRASGFIYPFVRPEAMFHAAVELRDQPEQWGLTRDGVAGSWDALLAKARSFDGTAVVSHEILAGSLPPVVERVARDTGDLDLHVVVTARDLQRQAVAHWQEQVKNGRDWTFATFERELFEESESASAEDGFWRMQDLPGVLSRWAAAVPADHVHVVTVPPGGPTSGVDPTELWRRFCDATGLEPRVLDPLDTSSRNDSLGVAQVQLLRQVVAALDGRIEQPHYAHVVKRWFAQRLLSEVDGPRAQCPRELAERLAPASTAAVEHVRAAGYVVHGDLDDLLPDLPAADVTHPDDVSAADLVHGVPEVLAEMLLEVARSRGSSA